MLSILCVILTIKVKVGIPESFKVGWYPLKKTGSSHLNNKVSAFWWTSSVDLIQNTQQLYLQGVQFLFFPIFSYFLSLLLFSPIFKLKPPIFPIFLAGEAKICNKIENGIIVVCVFE